MKKLIQLKLKILAGMVVRKYKPKVIGITGSVGKTGTKEAVYTVIKGKFKVRKSIKNYNNELGLPLTIVGAESPGKSLFGWIGVILKALKIVIFRDRGYPEVLVLEMGIDRPGDMDYLLKIVKPDIGILTMIGTVHAEFFGTRAKLLKEKAKLIKGVPKDGCCVINYDSEECRSVISDSRARVITYGLDEKAKMRAMSLVYSFENEQSANGVTGISFKLSHDGSATPVHLPGALGINAVYAALAAAAAGAAMGMNMVEISESIKKFTSPVGRMRLIGGIKRTTLIDDTYNAEPSSTIAALGALRRIPVRAGAKKFAVLGDMLELGKYSEDGHRDVGRYIARAGIDKLIVVGERSRDIARGAESGGMKRDNIFDFSDAGRAGRFLQSRIREGDLVLVKGSQGARMEKIVKEVMADPLRAGELLVRQDKSWK
jgi:UDP-N-acetylmuramoyl-tripeptide--D-alanyl-D-alanine ligase